MFLYSFLKINNLFIIQFNKLTTHSLNNFFKKIIFVEKFFKLNSILWQEGFFFDFLQKKVVDKWIRKFLVYSAYLLNEKFLFDLVIKFLLNLIIWPAHFLNNFEVNSVTSLFFFTILFLYFFFILIIFILFNF